MGILLSRVRSDPYYASYGKRFEKLDAECVKLQAQTQHLERISDSITGYYLLVSAALTIFAAAHAAWVHQQPAGTFEWDEHLLRTSPVVILPLLLWLGHEILLRFFQWKSKLRQTRLTKLMEKKRKMIKEVKDMTKFDTVSDFLKKWDPDYAPPAPIIPLPSGLASGPIVPHAQRTNSTPELLYRLTGGAASAAVGAAAGAGKSLLPLLDKVAQNVVGDSPMLVHDIRRLQHQLQAAESREKRLVMENTALKHHSAALYERLKELDPVAAEDLLLPTPYLLDSAQSSYGATSSASREEEATSSRLMNTTRTAGSQADAAEAGPSRSMMPPKAPGSQGHTPREHSSGTSQGGSTSLQPADSDASSTLKPAGEEGGKGVHHACGQDVRQPHTEDLLGQESAAS